MMANFLSSIHAAIGGTSQEEKLHGAYDHVPNKEHMPHSGASSHVQAKLRVSRDASIDGDLLIHRIIDIEGLLGTQGIADPSHIGRWPVTKQRSLQAMMLRCRKGKHG